MWQLFLFVGNVYASHYFFYYFITTKAVDVIKEFIVQLMLIISTKHSMFQLLPLLFYLEYDY